MKAAIVYLLVLFSTCNAQKKSVGDNAHDLEGRTTVKNKSSAITGDGFQDNHHKLIFIDGDVYSGYEEAETLIIKDAKSLQKFYARVNRTRKPGLPIPDIDFADQLAIIRCSGASETSDLPEIYVLEANADEMVLGIRQISEKSVSSAITTPFALYSLPRSKKNISIKE